MKTIAIYQCEICRSPFESAEAALACEAGHEAILDEKWREKTPKASKPKSRRVAEAVELLKRGAKRRTVAAKYGVSDTTVQMWFYRYVIYPEWKEHEEEIERDLEACP